MVDMDKVLALHEKHTGVLDIKGDFDVKTRSDLSEAYTPGVAGLAKLIESDPSAKAKYTMSGKLVGIISDGTAVLGLGNVGEDASLPIIEGKALLYKEFADVNAVPLAIAQKPVDEVVETIKNLSSSFAGIHLEDIAAPRCFEIEDKLKEELDIPVYHDDQEGTAIVVLAGLINAAKVVNKPLSELKVVLNGVGASGYATGKLLAEAGIKHITLVDIHGVVRSDDDSYNHYQRQLATLVEQSDGQTLDDVIDNQDVFIGLSDANVLSQAQVERMAENPIVFALANPIPEIDPDAAHAGGAKVVATGSSQWPNQVNNILAFPGLFKGLLSTTIKSVDAQLQAVIAHALAEMIETPDETHVVPGVFDDGVVDAVSKSIEAFAEKH